MRVGGLRYCHGEIVLAIAIEIGFLVRVRAEESLVYGDEGESISVVLFALVVVIPETEVQAVV